MRLDLDLTATEMLSHGSVALQEALPLGVLATTTATITRAEAVEAPLVVLHLGLATDVNAITTTTAAIPTMAEDRTTATEPLPLPVQRHGSNLLERRLDTEGMLVAMLVATLVALLWARLLVSEPLLQPLLIT